MARYCSVPAKSFGAMLLRLSVILAIIQTFMSIAPRFRQAEAMSAIGVNSLELLAPGALPAFIVRGRVASRQSFWSSDYSDYAAIETDNLIEVRYMVAGNPLEHLTVRTLGGYLAEEDMGMVETHAPSFQAGEEVLLFLHKTGEHYQVAGGESGKVVIHGPQAFIAGGDAPIPLDMLFSEIVSELQAQGRPSLLPENWQSLEPDVDSASVDQPEDFVYKNRKWGGPSPVVKYRVNVNTSQAGSDDGSVDDFRAAIIAAADSWSNVATADFTLVFDGETTATQIGFNQVNEIVFQQSSASGPAGLSRIWFTGDNIILEADMWLNDDLVWNATGSPENDELDLQSVALHEFGPGLALGHDDNSNAVMYATMMLGALRRILHDNDMAGIAFIYPCSSEKFPCGLVTPTPTPIPTPTPTPDDSNDNPINPVEILVQPTQDSMLVYTTTQGANLSVQIAAGTVETPTLLSLGQITRTSILSPEQRSVIYAFRMQASQNGEEFTSFSFPSPISITLHYTETQIVGLNENSLQLYSKQAGGHLWERALCVGVEYVRNPNEDWLLAPICHLTEFALLGEPTLPSYQVFLPLVRN